MRFFLSTLFLCSLLEFTSLSSPPSYQYVSFGDSITNPGGGASSPELAFIGLLSSQIGPIDNQGIDGSKIDQQYAAVRDYSGNATAAIWLLGYNDMRTGTDLESYRLYLVGSLDILAARGVTVYLGLCLRMTPEGYAQYGYPWNQGSDGRVDEMNAIIRDVAAGYQNVRVVDTNAVYNPYDNTLAADLVHPNDRGHQQIADAFRAALFPYVYYFPVIGK